MNTPVSGKISTFSARRAWAIATAGTLAIAGLMFTAGCGSGDVDRQPQTARPAEDTHQDFGDVDVHYNAIRTDQLTPDVARAYGIDRSQNRVLLNVAMLAKAADGRTTPVDGTVKAAAHNLNGQLKNLEMRRVQEGPAIYFIGDVGISGEEILVFNIDVEPATGNSRHSVRFKREFFAD